MLGKMENTITTTNLKGHDYDGKFEEWPPKEIIDDLSLSEVLNLRVKYIEWDYCQVKGYSKEYLARLRFTLNTGLQSPILGVEKEEPLTEKFMFADGIKISKVAVYGYGSGDCGMEFWDQNDISILKFGRDNSDTKELKLDKNQVFLGGRVK